MLLLRERSAVSDELLADSFYYRSQSVIIITANLHALTCFRVGWLFPQPGYEVKSPAVSERES